MKRRNMFLVLVFVLSCNLEHVVSDWLLNPVQLNTRILDPSQSELQRASEISPDDCLHNTICTKVEYYPRNSILERINNKDKLNTWFGTVLNTSYEPVADQRFGEFDSTSSPQLCRTIGPKTFHPLAMRNKNLEWKFIVNVENYVQGFTLELCDFETPRTQNLKATSLCHQLRYRCKQQYQQVFLLTYEEGEIEFDEFFIPVTCSCTC